jgi:hypothetical protein
MMKFMTLVLAKEGQGFPPPGLIQAIGEIEKDARKEGVFVDQGGLLPTATATRVRLSGGKITVTDGPFAEAKEVLGGFAIFNLKTKDEALKWTRRFMELHKEHWPEFEGVTEIRQMFEPGDFPKT